MSSLSFEQITVSKRDAVRQQLDLAIELFFKMERPIAVNTLSWAALDVLRGLAESKKIETFHNRMELGIKDEYVKDWRNILRKSYNFSKHADRDVEEILSDFRPEATSYTIAGACQDYFQVFNAMTWPMVVFKFWFMCRYPKIVLEDQMYMIEKMKLNFGFPEAKQFRDSTIEALEIVSVINQQPTLLNMLPKQWLQILES